MNKELKELSKKLDKLCDCSTCRAKCCYAHQVPISEAKIKDIISHLEISEQEFKQEFCEEGIKHVFYKISLIFFSHPKKPYTFLKAPCPFLNGTLCKIYNIRPIICRKFPFDLRPSILLVGAVGFCPVSTAFFNDIIRFCKIHHLKYAMLIRFFPGSVKIIPNWLLVHYFKFQYKSF